MTEAELARDLHAVLDRVQSGAEVIVERNAQPVAILRAAEPRRRKLSEIAAALAEHSTATIDPDFAKDVKDFVDRHREPLDSSAWESFWIRVSSSPRKEPGRTRARSSTSWPPGWATQESRDSDPFPTPVSYATDAF